MGRADEPPGLRRIRAVSGREFLSSGRLLSPGDVEEDQFLLAVSLLDQSYWVIGSMIGGIAGNFLPFDSEGIDFAMTALFVVIFVEQWMEKKNRAPEVIGVLAACFCLQIFGADGFVLPAMLLITLLLFVGRKRLEGGEEEPCR